MELADSSIRISIASAFAAVLLVFCRAGLAAESGTILFDFDGDRPGAGWRAVNDSVMGGVSKGGPQFPGDGTMVFAGSLSLENNGGFSSIRTQPKRRDLSGYDGLAARIRGDGRTYWLTVETNVRIPAGSYRVPVPTKVGQWQTVRAPFSSFRATSFGRELSVFRPLNRAKVESIGFLIADKQAGPFRMAVDWIKAVPAASAAAADAPKKDIVDTAIAAGSFKTLVAAAKAAGLVDTLKGAGPFTVFAPTDEAFAKLPKGTVESLLKPENKKKLAAILTLHVVGGRLAAADVAGASHATTVQGTDLLFATTATGVKVDRANVVKADVFATNGVIHVIDRVLLPKDVVETAAVAGQFKTLLAAAKAAGLVKALQAPDATLTVFAPTDKAFAALPAGTVEDLLRPANRERLAAILKHHVLARRVRLASRSLTTLQGDSVQVRAAGPVRVEEANVLLADLQATNGVIHVIDQVLLPELPEPTPARKAMSVIELAIERGVPLFNAGKPEACAAIYEVTARSLLTGHADALDEAARKRLREALSAVHKDHSPRKKACVLRYALDDVYRSLRKSGSR